MEKISVEGFIVDLQEMKEDIFNRLKQSDEIAFSRAEKFYAEKEASGVVKSFIQSLEESKNQIYIDSLSNPKDHPDTRFCDLNKVSYGAVANSFYNEIDNLSHNLEAMIELLKIAESGTYCVYELRYPRKTEEYYDNEIAEKTIQNLKICVTKAYQMAKRRQKEQETAESSQRNGDMLNVLFNSSSKEGKSKTSQNTNEKV